MTVNNEIQNIVTAIKEAIAVEKIYLFGSCAYGTQHENSDYDFFIVIPDDGIRPLEATQKARKALIPLQRRTAVDIIADYQSNFENRKEYNTLEKKVYNEGIILYEQA